MKILIVDDEKLARARLRHMLGELDAGEICGEAANGREALERASADNPDVVLLDIRMPGMDGLEAARHLGAFEPAPAVIFTTAYGDHALEAFDANAVDYLLKPIRKQRLAEALQKARRLTRSQADEISAATGGSRTHLSARQRGSLQLVAVSDIRCLVADQKYVSVHHPGGELLIEESLKTLEEEFGALFLRVHRNALVAVAYLEGFDKDRNGHYHVRLQGVSKGPEISRRQLADVRRVLKERTGGK